MGKFWLLLVFSLILSTQAGRPKREKEYDLVRNAVANAPLVGNVALEPVNLIAQGLSNGLIPDAGIASKLVARSAELKADLPNPEYHSHLYNKTNQLMKTLIDESNALAWTEEDNHNVKKYLTSLLQYFYVQINNNFYKRNSTDFASAFADSLVMLVAQVDKTALQIAAPVIKAGSVFRAILGIPTEVLRTVCKADTPDTECTENYLRMIRTPNDKDLCSNDREALSEVFLLTLNSHDKKPGSESLLSSRDLYSTIAKQLKDKFGGGGGRRRRFAAPALIDGQGSQPLNAAPNNLASNGAPNSLASNGAPNSLVPNNAAAPLVSNNNAPLQVAAVGNPANNLGSPVNSNLGQGLNNDAEASRRSNVDEKKKLFDFVVTELTKLKNSNLLFDDERYRVFKLIVDLQKSGKLKCHSLYPDNIMEN